jgi:hypothetical protein
MAYYQIVIQTDKTCTLRDWPKKRISQQASNSRLYDPGVTRCTWEEYISAGTWRTKIINIFGAEVWKMSISAIHQLQEKDKMGKNGMEGVKNTKVLGR